MCAARARERISYPEVRRRIEAVDPAWEPLSRECLRRFGCFPGPADTHVGEYLGWGWQYLRPEQTAWIINGVAGEQAIEEKVEFLSRGEGRFLITS